MKFKNTCITCFLFFFSLCLFLTSSFAEETVDVAPINFVYYNDKAELGMTESEFNDFGARGKKTYLVLSGEHLDIIKINDMSFRQKIQSSDKKEIIKSRHLATFPSELLNIHFAFEKMDYISLPDGIKAYNNYPTIVLELPAGVYAIGKNRIDMPPRYVYDLYGKFDHIEYPQITQGKDYLCVQLEKGQFFYSDGIGSINSNSNATIPVPYGVQSVRLHGVPGYKKRDIPLDALFTNRSADGRNRILSPYSAREVAVFTDKTMLGFKFIYKDSELGLGYLITYVDSDLIAWKSGLRAGDVITGIKGRPNLTEHTASSYLKESKVLLVKKLNSSSIIEVSILNDMD